jgi:hypothetical protein
LANDVIRWAPAKVVDDLGEPTLGVDAWDALVREYGERQVEES